MAELVSSMTRLFYKAYGRKVLKGFKDILLLVIFLLMKILQGVSVETIVKAIEALQPEKKEKEKEITK